MRSYAYGFPRIGTNREYKKAIELFWKGEISEGDLRKSLDQIQQDMLIQYEKNVDLFPVGEMTFYDNMLDTSVILGVQRPKDLKAYYDLCRGKNALGMTKWFNTNYHYLISDFANLPEVRFQLNWNKPQEYRERFKQGIPYLIGPFTFLKLSKGIAPKNFAARLLELGEVYRSLIAGLPEVHLDEPALVLDLKPEEIKLLNQLYSSLDPSGSKINLFTYYESVDCLKEVYAWPLKSIGLDFVHGTDNLEFIQKNGFPKDKTLIAGVVDGRNVWKTDLNAAGKLLQLLKQKTDRLMVSNAGPLYHLPISVKEERMEGELQGSLAFAVERLDELKALTLQETTSSKNVKTVFAGPSNASVQERVRSLKEADFEKSVPYADRVKLHQKSFNLPLFPTTTIGSFPQTAEIRKLRSDFKNKKISIEEYKKKIQTEIKKLIELQEQLGLDVLVHGEFERTDMVEFFAEKLDGIATTKAGWIISYGTRVYRPPIIFADVSRPEPMTLDEITYAQSLTKKPVKGMLTGPVTIIAWSFVREDIPIRDVAFQIALSLRDEIVDYERNNIRIVQIDEPALRERAPIKARKWDEYFRWAIASFKLASTTSPSTQIHTHMCYSEFGEIIEQIDRMDFDVITIETSKSRGQIIETFERFRFGRQIGLGVWDIHSPVVPKEQDMETVIQRSLAFIPKENFWINPDCGLKTRNWEETVLALKQLVETSHRLRKVYSK